MKKIIATLLALTMILAFAACSSTKNDTTEGEKTTENTSAADAEKTKVDMSAYPATINEWTIDNMMSYLKAAGVCVKDEWAYVQNEDECSPAETGISKCGSYMSDDDDGEQCLMVFWLNPAAEQSAVKEQYDYICKNKQCNASFENQPIDHVIGNFAFCYSVVSLDDNFVSAIDSALQNLATEMKTELVF